MRQATKNPDVLRRNDAQIKEAERGLSYFENTLRDLQAKKLQLSQGYDPMRSGSASSTPSGTPSTPRSARPSDRDRTLPPPPDYERGGSPMLSPGPGAGFDDIESAPKVKQYSNLDLIKADTPYNAAKISRMLHQLEFKLQVEMQYKKGIDKMAKLYQVDGDKKSRADAESKRVESEKKIQLLQSALKRYKNLHILDDAEVEEEEGEFLRNLTGLV
jgi:Hr1 repeat